MNYKLLHRHHDLFQADRDDKKKGVRFGLTRLATLNLRFNCVESSISRLPPPLLSLVLEDNALLHCYLLFRRTMSRGYGLTDAGPLQPQGIGNDRNRAKTHGQGCDHWGKQDAKEGE